ncbi:hypothetical protein [Cupriavidus lacunae]|uniref:hypothetical protein n=1 Tax=Cupriavidus lacunae TaxID=2666307 RepID=UPI001058EE7C|nr:hypothetical protein [Cupriavidus lacunae]
MVKSRSAGVGPTLCVEFAGWHGKAWLAFDHDNIWAKDPAPATCAKMQELAGRLRATVQVYAHRRRDPPGGEPGEGVTGADRPLLSSLLARIVAGGAGVLGLYLVLAAESGWTQLAGIFLTTFGAYYCIACQPEPH